MRKILFAVSFLAPVLVLAQRDSVLSQMYSWKKPVNEIQTAIFSTVLFEGSAHDMSFMQMTANILLPSSKKKTNLQVPGNEEHLLLVKTGTLSINISDSSWSIGAGSIALL